MVPILNSNLLFIKPNVSTYYFFGTPLNAHATFSVNNVTATVSEQLNENKQTFTRLNAQTLEVSSAMTLFQRFKNRDRTGLLTIGLIIGCTLLASGCDSADTEPHAADESMPSLPSIEYAAENDQQDQQNRTTSSDARPQSQFSIDYPGIDHPDVVQATDINNTADAAASQIIQSLHLGKARLAAQSRHKCPKLLNSAVGSNRIVRSKDLMVSDHCDYYIYPMRGSMLHVESQPSQLKSVLIAPESYDFFNGGYKVERPGKYIIRVYDTSIEPRNEPIDYDVTVSIY